MLCDLKLGAPDAERALSVTPKLVKNAPHVDILIDDTKLVGHMRFDHNQTSGIPDPASRETRQVIRRFTTLQHKIRSSK